MTSQPRNRRILPRIFEKKLQEENRMYPDPVAESLNRSRNNLNQVNKNVASCMKRTANEVRSKWGDHEPPRQEPNIEPMNPEPQAREHQEVRSDYDYETPYGKFDKNNYHAVCIDIKDTIYFLAGESKEELEQQINNDDKIKDVLAVYGGNLIYYHERRYLHLG